jgi:hypothetical protein
MWALGIVGDLSAAADGSTAPRREATLAPLDAARRSSLVARGRTALEGVFVAVVRTPIAPWRLFLAVRRTALAPRRLFVAVRRTTHATDRLLVADARTALAPRRLFLACERTTTPLRRLFVALQRVAPGPLSDRATRGACGACGPLSRPRAV